MKSITKDLIIAIMVIAIAPIATLFAAIMLENHMQAQDDYIANRVVMLRSAEGSCSGIQVIAPSHKAYILTAAHCAVLVAQGHVEAISESGAKKFVKFIEIDKESDLMLLEAMDDSGIEIADSVAMHDHVRAITHGSGFDRYRTDGEMLGEIKSQIPVAEVQTAQQDADCRASGHGFVFPTPFGMLCIKTMISTITTAKVVPGSSGGATVDDEGHLVGIVSMGDEAGFGYLVRLNDIKAFMATK